MNKLKYILLISILSLTTFFVACDKENDDLVTATASEGGLLTPQNPAINYIVGNNKEYTATIKVFQGAVKTNTVEVYKQFISKTAGSTNKVLLTTLNIDASKGTGFTSYNFKFEDLIKDLTFANNSTISTDDQLLNIGDKWVLSYVSTTSEGNKHANSNSNAATNVSVATRYAGTYEVIASDYWRIDAQSSAANWVGARRIIESIDATTYLHKGFGPFAPDDDPRAFLYFTISPDLQIDYLASFNGAAITGLGTYLISCDSAPNDMPPIPCGAGTSDYVVKDDLKGEDILYMSYGYMTTSGAIGPRRFYEVLKKVNE